MESVVPMSHPTTPLEASRFHSTLQQPDQQQLNDSTPSSQIQQNTPTATPGTTGTQDAKAAQPQDVGNVAGIVPVLQNVVATVNLECRLDLKTIALHARNAEYNPKRFAAVIMRIREPKTTSLIFASGKMVVTGAKSEDDR